MRVAQVGVMFAVGLLTLGIGVAPDARADNTTCANADPIFPGMIAAETLTAGASVYFKAPVVSGRSYSLTSFAPNQDEADGAFAFVHSMLTEKTCTTAAATQSSSKSEPNPDFPGAGGGFHNGDHDSIIPNFTGLLYIRVLNFAAVTVNARVRFIETTLFSPWWFTGGTNQAFVEIRNTTNASVDYTATFKIADGSTCGTSSGSIPANGNTALAVRSIGTCANTSGSAQLAFQGQPNALVANITTIDGVQATSFDAPFKARMEVGTWRR